MGTVNLMNEKVEISLGLVRDIEAVGRHWSDWRRGEVRQTHAVELLCGAADPRAYPVVQSELQRNFQVLSKQDPPAYFMSYTLHDTRTASIARAEIAAMCSCEGGEHRS